MIRLTNHLRFTKVFFASLMLIIGGSLTHSNAQKELQNTQNRTEDTLRNGVRIDPATHSLSIQVPLTAYPGRGGSSLPMTLYYSSKLWRLEFDDIYENPSGGAPRTQTFAKYAEQTVAGWSSSVDVPTLEFTFKDQVYDLTSVNYGQDGGPTGYRGFIARIHVHLPDGTTYELRKDDAPHNWGTETNYGYTGTYYSVDGARMRFDFDQGARSGVLYMPDGSKYTFAAPFGAFPSDATQFTDRNGNTLTYNATTKQWTDTMGRTFSPLLPIRPAHGEILATGDYQYTLPGAGTSSMVYTVKWRYLNDPTTGETVLSNPDPDPNNRLYYPGSHKCTTWPAQALTPHMFDSTTLAPICASQKFNPIVLAEIVLPNNTSYRFRYNPYGEIDKIFFPNGSYERYAYTKIAPMTFLKAPYDQVNRAVSDRWLSSDGTAGAEIHWQYGIEYTIGTTGPYVATCTEPDGTVRKEYLHAHPFNYGVPGDFYPQYKSVPFGMDDARTGRPYEERVYSSTGTLLRRKLLEWTVTPSTVTTGPPGPYGNRNPRLTKEVEILLEPGSTQAYATTVTHEYDTTYQFTTGVNQTAVNDFDFVTMDQSTAASIAIESVSTGTALRRTETSFLDTTNQTYRDRNMLGLVSSVIVRDMTRGLPAGVVVAQSSNTYDEASYSLLTCGSPTNWVDPGSSIRGNATSSASWLNYDGSTLSTYPAGTSLTTHQQFDQCGNLRNAWDAKGNQRQISYSSTFNYAFPTTMTSAVPDASSGHSSNAAFVSTYNYDFNTGLLLSNTNPNGQTTSLAYNDPLNRLTQVTRPDGGHTTYVYSDTAGDLYVRVLEDQDATRSIETRQYLDGLGRPIRKFIYNGTGGTPWVVTDTYYDNLGRVAKVSNPYEVSAPSSIVPATCSACTVNTYDVLGRVVTVTTPDGAHTDTAFDGGRILVTDQAGKKLINQADGLGRLRDSWEVTAADQWTSSISFPNHPEIVAAYGTHYNYDALGNVVEIVQGIQAHRFFMYDSLGRLIRARNPEQGTYGADLTEPISGNNAWSAKYAYDNNGNLTQKTDPRGIVATYGYDALNRNTTITYSDGTPRVDRYFDGATNGKNLFWYEKTSNPSTNALIDYREFTAYDVVGRPTVMRQVFASDSVNYDYNNIQRAYNLAGLVTSLTYPSGHTVTYNYDAGGRLADLDSTHVGFAGNLGAGGSPRTYSQGISYAPAGQLKQEQFGTTTPVYNKLFYNSRQQLAEILASTTGGDSSWNRGKIVNGFSLQCSGAGCNATDNNGSLRKQEVYVPGNDQVSTYTSWYQQYDYDAMNRLQRVHEYTGNSSLDWQQEYVYDRWGNRTIHQTNTFGPNIPKPNFGVNTANNRLTAPAGYTLNYDAVGNVTTDTLAGAGDRTFDAESRMTGAGGGSSQYTYNAGGQRVRRKISNQETWQIYGFDGELLAEYPAKGAASGPTKEYGYRNGQLLISAESGVSLAPPTFADDFNDNSLNATSWTIDYPGSTPTVSEQSQQLQMALAPNTAAYNGVHSNATYNLTNKMVQVESVQAVSQAGWCENFFEAELDASNYFMIQVGAGNMIFRSMVSGVNDQTSIAFDGAANRFWRVRHDQGANLIYFETSADGNVWLTRKTVTPGFSLTSLRFRLIAGAYGTGNSTPGTAKYDNFKLLASSANSSLTVPNGGFEAPVVGNGNFQYGPTGGSWTFANGGGISGMNSPFTGVPSAAPEGVQVAFIQATGTVSQSISGFQASSNYVITFKAIQRTNCCNTTGQDIGVYLDNTLLGTFHPSNVGYVEYSTPAFATTTGAHTVKFAGLNGAASGETAFIDNVRITGSPKPGYGLQWLVTDHLGTPRMVLDESGALANVKRHDYLPFGEELNMLQGLRTQAAGYVSGDGVRQQFTAKERDGDTGLDYFINRYFSSTQGRFTSIDPLMASGKPAIPQSWNRYAYCLNGPLTLTDPKGLIWGYQDFEEGGKKFRRFVWFKGNRVDKGFTPFTPEKNGTVIALKDGNYARIYRHGTYDLLAAAPKITTSGQERLNVAAGLFDGFVPFGRQIREAAFGGGGGVDTDSPEYNNASTISNGTMQGALLLTGIGEAEITEEAIGLGKQVASESQLAEVMAGEGKAIIGAGTKKVLTDGPRLASEYGGTADEWAKISSTAYEAKDGSIIEVHAYKNIRTGQVVEPKSVSSSFPARHQ